MPKQEILISELRRHMNDAYNNKFDKLGLALSLADAINAIESEVKNKELLVKFVNEIAEPNLKGLASDYPDSSGFEQNLEKLESLRKQIGE